MQYPSSPAAVPRPLLPASSSPSSLVLAIALALLFSFLLGGRLASLTCSVTTSSWSARTQGRSVVVVKTQRCGLFGCTTVVQSRTTIHAR